MKKIFFIIFILFSCSQDGEVQELTSQDISTTTGINEAATTLTAIEEKEIEQLGSFSNVFFKVDEEKSSARYLAPKVFLNTNEEIVVGETQGISGSFELSIGECDSSDSCILIKNLKISADLIKLNSNNSIRDNSLKSKWLESELYPIATYSIEELILPNNNFDSRIDETITGVLTIREIDYIVPFSISAYMDNELVYVYGVSQIETLWFGFDPPSKFGAWDVLNPIGIEIEIVATR
tara:strand:+ start:492 stop:1202 length:711 start_codon:yes stop_codon:yes gene_type:complete